MMTKNEIIVDLIRDLCNKLNTPMPKFGKLEFVIQDGQITDINKLDKVEKKYFN